MYQEVQMSTLEKGDIIYGNFNIQVSSYKYIKCMCIEKNNIKQFISIFNIANYKCELFPKINKDLCDTLIMLETLSNNQLKFDYKKILNLLKGKHNYTIYLNQEYLTEFMSNDRSQYYFKYMEGIYINNKLIPIYLLPKENHQLFLIDENSEENSYICFT